jgi:hypothetical protein
VTIHQHDSDGAAEENHSGPNKTSVGADKKATRSGFRYCASLCGLTPQ